MHLHKWSKWSNAKKTIVVEEVDRYGVTVKTRKYWGILQQRICKICNLCQTRKVKK